MAEEKIIKVIKEVKKQSFKVFKEFTLDKVYKVGSKIELSDKKVIDKLITNKFIK